MPWPSCSTAALLALLLRFWASPSQQSGLLMEATGATAARTLTDIMVGELMGEAVDLRLMLSVKAEVRWPRPEGGENPVVMRFDADLHYIVGSIDFDELPERRDPIATWMSDLVGMHRVTLLEVLQEAVAWKPRKLWHRDILLGQLIAQVSVLLEDRLRTERDAANDRSTPLELKVSQLDPMGATTEDVCVFLLRYWNSQNDLMAFSPKHLSLVSDKSRVLGSSLLIAFVTLPGSDVAWLFLAVHIGLVFGGCQFSLSLSLWCGASVVQSPSGPGKNPCA